jgi:hypothetical protein
MLGPVRRCATWLRRLHGNQRIATALARGAATSAARILDISDPRTWEFTAFSQNGEDGILDVLTRHLVAPNAYFIEIGAASGLENNSSWLAIGRRFSGLMIEGDLAAHAYARDIIVSPWTINVSLHHLLVHRGTLRQVFDAAVHRDPDVLSIDIDSIDYYVAQGLLELGLRPKILAVEYNSAFGPSRACTVRYACPWTSDVPVGQNLYYGASISAWRSLLGGFGYRFVTVEQNGTNAFFVNPQALPSDFLGALRGIEYRENAFQFRRHNGAHWEQQFQMIAHLDIVDV